MTAGEGIRTAAAPGLRPSDDAEMHFIEQSIVCSLYSTLSCKEYQGKVFIGYKHLQMQKKEAQYTALSNAYYTALLTAFYTALYTPNLYCTLYCIVTVYCTLTLSGISEFTL